MKNRYWTYVEPAGPNAPDPNAPVWVTLSEEEILNRYFAHWCKGVIRRGNLHRLFKEYCIEDFTVIHWAWRTDAAEIYPNQ